MKSFFGVITAALFVVLMMFATVPEAAQAKKVGLEQMRVIKGKADSAFIFVKQKHFDKSSDRHAKKLYRYAESNAQVAYYFLLAVEAGEEVSFDEADSCAFIADMVQQAVGFILSGDRNRATSLILTIEVRMDRLPIARAAALVVVKVVVKNQSLNNRFFVIINERRGKKEKDKDNDDGKDDKRDDDKDDHSDRCVACQEEAKVTISVKCVAGRKVEEIETLFKCRKNYGDHNYNDNCTYKKRTIREMGPCCVINADCDDNNTCTIDYCAAGVCHNDLIHFPSPDSKSKVCP